jgi:hypothetical protein
MRKQNLKTCLIAYGGEGSTHLKITNLKHQITNKLQISIPNDLNRHGCFSAIFNKVCFARNYAI